MEGPAVFGLGCLGGAIAEFLGLYKLRHLSKAERPAYLKSGWYWTLTAIMVALGGGVALVYRRVGVEVGIVLAVNIGASAPLILTRLVSTAPPEPGKIG